MIRNTLTTVAVQVVAPIGIYLLLVHLGVPAVWALVASAGVSVVNLVVGWVRTHELSTLSLIVLAQFVLGLAVAGITGDPRLVLLKDYAVTSVIALGAAVSLRWRRPFIARVRRELSPDPSAFDRRWRDQSEFRRVHRRLTTLWVAGLAAQVVVAVIVIYSAPLTVAVVVTNVLTPAVLLVLIATTQLRAARVPDTTDVAAC